MDRFIDGVYCMRATVACDLKSNMDRFIVSDMQHSNIDLLNLKSNMDRFIVLRLRVNLYMLSHLKSNMDRFIVREWAASNG